MGATFTPGPWRVSSDVIWAKSPWNAEVRIATLQRHSPTNGIDWKANAQLIAAAPDMLTALMKISVNLSGLSKSEDDIYAAMVRRCDAAINKAVAETDEVAEPAPDATNDRAAALTKALRLTSAALLSAARTIPNGELRVITFTGEWSHLGSMTVGEILDVANEALEPKESA